MNKTHLKERIERTDSDIRQHMMTERLEREDIDLVRLVIRRELASVFFDLFKKKNQWI